MKVFLINLLLALLWAAVSESFSVTTLSLGFGIGYVVLAIAEPLWANQRYAKKFWLVIGLTLYFLKELLESGLRVGVEVVRPNFSMKPGIVYIPLDLESDLGITVLANLITLTPGTISLFVTDDRSQLCIHSMYTGESPDEVRKSIKEGFESWVMAVFEE